MTDTTDIKALRIKAANVIGLLTAESLAGSFALDSLADVFDDMFRLLEAERHKGDLWFGKVADLEAALKAERQRADDLQRINDIQETTIAVFRHKELAALKAKLANPVVLPRMAAVHAALSAQGRHRTSPENVSDVLNALCEYGFTVKE